MAGEYMMSLYVICGAGAAIAIGFSLPPLTSGGTSSSIGVNEAVYRAHVQSERSYCEANRSDVNCKCFAQRSGVVQSFEQPQVRGFTYAEQKSLARAQAAKIC